MGLSGIAYCVGKGLKTWGGGNADLVGIVVPDLCQHVISLLVLRFGKGKKKNTHLHPTTWEDHNSCFLLPRGSRIGDNSVGLESDRDLDEAR